MREGSARPIVVVGEASAAARPDRCGLSVSLRAMRDDVGAAIGAVSEVADATFRALREIDISDGDVATVGLNLQPWMDRESRTVTAQVATYNLTVSVAGIARVPEVVDALTTAAGDALQIHHVVFSHSNPAPLLAPARRAATRDGRARAEQLAQAAGVRLGALLHISEGGAGGWRGFAPLAARAMPAAGMPVEPGDQSVRIRVELTFEIDA